MRSAEQYAPEAPVVGQALADVQRRRLLEGVMSACAQAGTAAVPVETIIRSAGMSRRTFYDLFRDSEECVVAALRAGYAQIGHAVKIGYDARPRASWTDRVRTSLIEVFALLDAQPDLAQLCVVYARGGGDTAVDVQQTFVSRLAAGLQRCAREGGARDQVPDELTLILVGGIHSLVESRLAMDEQDGAGLQSLVGTVMYSVCMVYEGTPNAAGLSRRAPAQPVHDWSVVRYEDPEPAVLRPEVVRPDLVQRTLLYLVASPGATNTETARQLSINPKTIARHLSWMADRGLIVDKGPSGTRNAWHLTVAGSEALREAGAST